MAKKTNPKPSKNTDGQPKQPAANPTGGPAAAPTPPGQAPSLVPPGGPKPMDMVQTRINFKDLPPMAQAQQEEMQGMNPAAPLQMIQGQLASSMQEPGGPQQPQGDSPVPASFIGPMTPPGTENFPHDMAALMQVMARGYAPGSTPAEHAMAQNAHSMARMAEQHAQGAAADAAQTQAVHAQLGGLIQQLGMNGQLPPPDELAAAIARKHAQGAISQATAPQGAPPQVQSSY